MSKYTSKEKHAEYERKRRRRLRSSEPNYAILYRVRRSAAKRGLEFNLDLEDIVLVDKCPYLGCELTYDVGHVYCPTQATVDRIDSAKGYVKGNIQIISAKANTMKSNATEQELLTFAESVFRLHGA